jgi:ABC-type Na+ efflux pump permease subunit
MVIRFDLRHSSPTGRFLILFLTLVVALFAFPSVWILPEGWRQNQGFPAAWFSPPIFPAAVLLLHYLLKFAVAAEACHALGSERRNGTLESLLVTPAGEEVIVRGQLLALKRRYAFPVLFILAFQALLALTGLPRLGPGEQLVFTAILAAATIWLLVDLYALAWVGLWCGLRASHTSQAIRQTLVLVLVLPWALLLAGCALVALCVDMRFVAGWLVAAGFLGIFGAALVGNMAWSIYSLEERFREVASTPEFKARR